MNILFILVVLSCILTTECWTFVPMTDDNLIDTSHSAIIGTVEATIEIEIGGVYTHYLITIDDVLKHHRFLPKSKVIISVLGGYDNKSNATLHVPGAPSYQTGENVLLFLSHEYISNRIQRNIVYQRNSVYQFSIGSFLKANDYALRNPIAEPKTTDNSKVRNFSKFAEYIRWKSNPKRTQIQIDNYWVSYEDNIPLRSRFHTFEGDDGSPPRWFVFDNNQAVNWYRDSRGQPGISGGGNSQIQDAINSWNNQPNTPINYVNVGTGTDLNGFKSADQTNMIIFEDPDNDIDGAYDCNSGGVLAIGGYWSAGKGNFRSKSFYKIVEGDVVTQNGLSCFIAQPGGAGKYANMMTHELGHTLGLDHSCGDTKSGQCITGSDADKAIMRAYVNDDGGTTLGDDDVLAIEYLYALCYPNCNAPAATTAPTTSPLTTKPLTTQALSTQALTSGAVRAIAPVGTDDGDSSDSSSKKILGLSVQTAAIIGGAIGLVLLVIILMMALKCLGNSNRRKETYPIPMAQFNSH